MENFIEKLDGIVVIVTSLVYPLGICGYLLWMFGCYLAAFFVMLALIAIFIIQIAAIVWYAIDIIRMILQAYRREHAGR